MVGAGAAVGAGLSDLGRQGVILMGLTVLVLNCGSSSVKFQVIEIDPETGEPTPGGRRARGVVERIGRQARVSFEAAGGPVHQEAAPLETHAAAVRRIVDWILPRAGRLDVVGHRVVHGGGRFVDSVLIDAGVAGAIEALEALAPLHNGPSLEGIRAAAAALGPEVPMVAVFDTAFHASLPEHARGYAIPHELSLRHGIRRFGFHGTSYRSVLAGYARLTGTPAGEATIVALHLGNGCSAAAIKHGRSVDTSMGFTPLEGLVMGTRSGDLDPSLVGYLARAEALAIDEVERLLNERSGLLGVSGLTGDMRELLERAGRGEGRARLAVEMFCYRARKYVGAYLAALGGADAVVFTGGIGEHAPAVRAKICEAMAWCGLTLDPVCNEAAVGVAARISPDDARLHAYVIPTDEELVIAADAAGCVRAASPSRPAARSPS